GRREASVALLLEARISASEQLAEDPAEVPLGPALRRLELRQLRLEPVEIRRPAALEGEEGLDQVERGICRVQPPAEVVAASPGLQGTQPRVQVPVVVLRQLHARLLAGLPGDRRGGLRDASLSR